MLSHLEVRIPLVGYPYSQTFSVLMIFPVITSLITLLIVGHAIFIQLRNNPFTSHGSIYQISRLVIEALTFLLWVATVVLMLRHKGGCDGDRSLVVDGVRLCYSDDTHFKLYSDRPNTQWLCGLAFAFVDL